MSVPAAKIGIISIMLYNTCLSYRRCHSALVEIETRGMVSTVRPYMLRRQAASRAARRTRCVEKGGNENQVVRGLGPQLQACLKNGLLCEDAKMPSGGQLVFCFYFVFVCP